MANECVVCYALGMEACVSPPPAGLIYRDGCVDEQEEQALLARFGQLQFGEVRMHGVVGKRRVVHFGWDYGYDSWRVEPAAAIPEYLLPLRARWPAVSPRHLPQCC